MYPNMPKQTSNSMFKRGNHVTFVGNVPNKFKFGVDPQSDLAEYPRSGDQGKVGRKIGAGWYLVKLDRNGSLHKVRAGPYMKMTSNVEAAQKELGNNSAPGLDLLIRTNQVEALQQENQRLAALVARWRWQFDEEVKANRELTAQLTRSQAATNALEKQRDASVAAANEESLAYHKSMSDTNAAHVLTREALAASQDEVRALQNEVNRLTIALEDASALLEEESEPDSDCSCHHHHNEPETSEAWNPSMPVRWGTEHEEADKAAAAEYCTDAVLEDGEWVEPHRVNLQTTTWGVPSTR
jgi:HAMP domain-containing protein